MPESRLHHVGFVVASVADSIHPFTASLGAKPISEVIHDPLQKVFVAFLQPPSADSVMVELVSPTAESSPVSAFLARGGGFHHICYEVDDLEAALYEARSRKALILRQPKPAVAFSGRRIAWIITPEKFLIEFLERSL